ncbi:MAG: hypothetical protein AAGA94_07160, partial [Pseudomonadota bacterium]
MPGHSASAHLDSFGLQRDPRAGTARRVEDTGLAIPLRSSKPSGIATQGRKSSNAGHPDQSLHRFACRVTA